MSPSARIATPTLLVGLLLLTACAPDAPLLAHRPSEAVAAATPPAQSGLELKLQPASADSAAVSPDAKRIRLCTEVCEKTAQLNCANMPNCTQDCAGERGDDPCAPAVDSLMSCLFATPVGSFECGPDGVPGIKSGHCEAEQAASMKCLLETAELGA